MLRKIVVGTPLSPWKWLHENILFFFEDTRKRIQSIFECHAISLTNCANGDLTDELKRITCSLNIRN